jgi:hypothetical protein
MSNLASNTHTYANQGNLSAKYPYIPPHVPLQLSFIHTYLRNYENVSESSSTRRWNGVTHIQRQRLGAVDLLVSKDTHQTLTTLEQTSLQTNNNELHSRTRMLLDIVLDLLYVGVIERSIDLIKNEERTGLVRVHSEEECEGSHRLLTTGKMLHVTEALEGRHGMVFDARQIWAVAVLDVEICLTSEREGGGAGEILVDVGNLV